MARARTAPGGKEEFLAELDEEQTDIWAHRFEADSFVRAYAWAKRKDNTPKACLVYADAHEGDFEESDEPVVIRD